MRRASLLLASALAACESTTATPITCETDCIADPLPHCVADPVCTDDANCPSGLTCVSDSDSLSCSRAETGCTCRWRARQPPRLVLIDGFVTHAMPAAIIRPPALGITWSPPAEAQFVACAVFTCTPVFRLRGVHDNHSDEPVTDDGRLWRIANAEACILELHVTDRSRMSIPIEGTRWQPDTPMCRADQRYSRIPDYAAAGCWAYDDTSVIAASELIPIAPGDLAPLTSELAGDAGCARDGDLCFDPAHAFQGACFRGLCEPRCMTADDCARADALLFGIPDSGNTWDCQPVAGSLAGVCTPDAE